MPFTEKCPETAQKKNMEQILNFFKRTKNNKEFIQVMKHSLLKK